MDNDIVGRIKQLMEYNSLNSLSLAKKLGYNSSEKLSRLFRGGNAKPSYDIIYDIANKFEIDADWLITGRGCMKKNDTTYAQESYNIIREPEMLYRSNEADVYYKLYKEKDEEVKKQAEEIGALKVELQETKKKLQETDKKIEYYQTLIQASQENPEPNSPITRPSTRREENPHISKTFGSAIHVPGDTSSSRPGITK